MDLQQNCKSPVLGDHVPPLSNSTLGLSTNLLSYSPFSSGRIPTVPIKKLIPGNLDNGPGSGWIHAMKSSSPPRGNRNQEEEDSAYSTWVDEYPSALTSFDQIIGHVKAKKIALFLDYDGTLSPIVDNPDRAFMSHSMRAAVRSVAECFPTAIISGRSRDKVFKFIGLTELYYAGSHGMDIMGPLEKADQVKNHPNYNRPQGKALQMFQPASKFMPTIKEVFRSLVESIKSVKGAMVENNKFCVSVHYRLVEEKNWPIVAQIVKDILEKHPNLRLTHGRKVLEVRPVIDWDKGKAVEFLLESLGYNCLDYVLPIYIGDDRTDEDAFKVLRERNCGYGILVSSKPKISSAFYSLRDPSEVREFLESLVKWKKSTLSSG